MSEEEAALLNNLGSTLIRTSKRLEQLGADLCGDPAIVAEHMELLQYIDFACQVQKEIAGVLTNQDILNAAQEVRLESLSAR